MTGSRRTLHVVINAALGKRLPPVGSLMEAPRADTTCRMKVLSVRTLVSQGGRVKVSMQRVRPREVPPDAVIHPWPRLPVGTPPKPAEAREPGPIELTARRARAQRERVMGLLADDRLTDRPVPVVRLGNASAQAGDWRDPDDKEVNRREPKVVHGYRSFDVIGYMVQVRTINIGQARAARKLRDQYDFAVAGARIGYDRLQQSRTGFGPSDGPSGSRMLALEEYEAARLAVGVAHWGIVEAVIIGNQRVGDYVKDRQRLNANRRYVSHYAIHAKLMEGLDRLSDHYVALEKVRRREIEAVA